MKAIVFAAGALSLLTANAFGADLGLPIKAAPMAAPFTWTSCYAGGQAGGGWGQKNVTDSAAAVAPFSGFTSANVDISGYMVGGQIGCDYQFAPNWVVGIEGAATGGRIGGSTVVAQPAAIPGDGATFKETTDFLSTATARVGYAWDRWLFYAKGGAAWAGDRYSATGVFSGRRSISKAWRLDSVGPRAPGLSGRFPISGRSKSNTTSTASAIAA